MQGLYNRDPRYSQAESAPDVESINILEIAAELPDVSLPDQVNAFWSRLPEKPSKRHSIRAIADEWLTGCYDADEAVGWLRVLKLQNCPVSADSYETMSTMARREFGPVALPERPQQVSELVRVTAQARERRMDGRAIA